MIRALAVFVATAVAGCGGTAGVGAVRFLNRPPAWRVADRRDVAVAPARRRVLMVLETFDSVVYRPVVRALDPWPDTGAGDVNSLDEVPDSTWFHNRIGRSPMSPVELARGAGGNGPDLAGRLRVTSSKIGSAVPGFVALDRTGRRFLVKLDAPVEPTLATGTHVVVNRLLWACGYHVPRDHLGRVTRGQLALAAGATYTDGQGRRRAMRTSDLDALLARAAREPDGSYRALFSEYLPGIPLGGFAQEGVRDDDPNDTVPHERRRSLRGLSAIAGWLQHTDMREHNTLDMYVTDPDTGSRYVEHHLIDFDKALGAWTVLSHSRPADGHAGFLLDRDYAWSAVTFGLWRRPWEGLTESPITGIARFDAEHFDPGRWATAIPYLPFVMADGRDMLWAVDILLRFTPGHVRAAVRAGQFVDPRAEDALTDILLARRDKTARYWLSRVNPLARFALAAGADGRVQLCFEDLELDPRVRPDLRARSRHRLTLFDADGHPLGLAVEQAPAAARSCLAGLPLAGGREGYTIVRVDTTRGGGPRRHVEVHLARDPATRAPRIVGVVR